MTRSHRLSDENMRNNIRKKPTSGFTSKEYRKLEIEADFLGALRGEVKANL